MSRSQTAFLAPETRLICGNITNIYTSSNKDPTSRDGLPNAAISRILSLASLAHDIVAAIRNRPQPSDLKPARQRGLPDLPRDWVAQRAPLGVKAN